MGAAADSRTPALGDRLHLAEQDPALLGIVAAHQHLVIGAVEEPVGKAPRERELHLLHVARRERHRPAGPGLRQWRFGSGA